MRIHEVVPPVREKQVKKLKKKVDDKSIAQLLLWAKHNKHSKSKKESQKKLKCRRKKWKKNKEKRKLVKKKK